jgi:hypothetical protein
LLMRYTRSPRCCTPRPALSHPSKKIDWSLPILLRQLIRNTGYVTTTCSPASGIIKHSLNTFSHCHCTSCTEWNVRQVPDLVVMFVQPALCPLRSDSFRRNDSVFIRFGYCLTSIRATRCTMSVNWNRTETWLAENKVCTYIVEYRWRSPYSNRGGGRETDLPRCLSKEEYQTLVFPFRAVHIKCYLLK